jgi:hypothetical protein
MLPAATGSPAVERSRTSPPAPALTALVWSALTLAAPAPTALGLAAAAFWVASTAPAAGAAAGHKIVVVKDTVTNKDRKSTGLMYLAAKGPALVYKIVDDTPSDVSTIVFNHYGNAVILTVPPNAINLSSSRRNYLNMSPRTLAAPTPAAAPSTPRWSSGMYSPMTPASTAIGIDCSQIRPGPVSTAKWWPSEPM